ncbi:hypothetical protein ONZ45_g16165 [Pleurotus djamor]|nr:hypothetical protein ONZ45_g16165 [Pleurotus djamor]
MARYPRLIKSQGALLGEIAMDTVEKIKANPEEHLTLLIFGAGDALRAENPLLIRHVQSFIKSLCAPGMPEPEVADPPKFNPQASSEWGKPHVYILSDISNDLRDYLLWFQTFAFQIQNFRIAISALPLDENIYPWYICDFYSLYIDGEQRTRDNVMRTIKNTLKTNADFRNLVDTCVGMLDTRFANLDQRVEATLRTFEFVQVALEDDIYVLQLYAEPIAIDAATHNRWINIITHQRYFVSMNKLKVQTRDDRMYMSCRFCKDDTHDVNRCPFPLVEDWKGPIPKEVLEARTPLWNSAQSPLTRGQSRGRGSRGQSRGRGTSRGPYNSQSRGRGRGLNQ